MLNALTFKLTIPYKYASSIFVYQFKHYLIPYKADKPPFRIKIVLKVNMPEIETGIFLAFRRNDRQYIHLLIVVLMNLAYAIDC
jgi:hypothetical protein